MSNTKSIGWVGLVVGIVLVLVALFGSQFGLGGGFGTKHIIVLVVGIVLVVVGAYLAWRGPARA